MPIRATFPGILSVELASCSPLKGRSIIIYGIPCVVVYEGSGQVYLTVLGSTHIFNIDRQYLENFGYERVS